MLQLGKKTAGRKAGEDAKTKNENQQIYENKHD